MRPSPLSDLTPVARGTALLARHPVQTAGLAILTLALSFLGPGLQLARLLPDDPSVSMILVVVSLIPLELYFMPRFLLSLDAETIDHPQNPRDVWQATFESRWMKAFTAKLALYLVAGAGATCFLFPGLMVLALFGWTPYRVLLRGETLKDAAKGSAFMMTRLWPRVLLPLLVMMLVQFAALYGAMWIESRFVPTPTTPWIRLTHPAVWGIELTAGLLNLWISATFLALFHRLELYGPVPDPPAPQA